MSCISSSRSSAPCEAYEWPGRVCQRARKFAQLADWAIPWACRVDGGLDRPGTPPQGSLQLRMARQICLIPANIPMVLQRQLFNFTSPFQPLARIGSVPLPRPFHKLARLIRRDSLLDFYQIPLNACCLLGPARLCVSHPLRTVESQILPRHLQSMRGLGLC